MDANGEAVSVNDDAGRWIGEFQDSYLDHTALNGSTIFGSMLMLFKEINRVHELTKPYFNL